MRKSFQPVTDAIVAQLEAICPGRVMYHTIKEEYRHDEMTEYGKFDPEVVVEVLETAEVAAVMKLASRHHIAVTPRGSGTGLCGGCGAIHGGIVLSTAKMKQVLEVDEETLTATVQPGIMLLELNQLLLPYRLFYAPDPGEKTATIGGNVSTNAGGMRAVKYGVTRSYVLGLEVVLPSGEILKLGGKVMKNSSGYSLKDLMIGSEGTLGIITEITVKLLPIPIFQQSLLIPFASLESCISCVPAILRSSYIPTALEYMEQEVIATAEQYLGKHFPDKSADAYLLLSYDGHSKQEVEYVCDQVSELCLRQGALDVLISNTAERHEMIWSARGAFLEAIKSSTTEMDECDVVIPTNKIAQLVLYSKELAQQYQTRIMGFGHAGDGNLHLYILKDGMDDVTWEEKRSAIMDKLYDKAAALSGQVSGEHGIGHAKVDFLVQSLGRETILLMQGIKQTFDPLGILNPGKVVR